MVALLNLALEGEHRILIVTSGALPAFVNLLKTADVYCQIHFVTALENLAKSSDKTHKLMLSELCLSLMCSLIEDKSSHMDIKRSISHCLALFASNSETTPHLLQVDVAK